MVSVVALDGYQSSKEQQAQNFSLLKDQLCTRLGQGLKDLQEMNSVVLELKVFIGQLRIKDIADDLARCGWRYTRVYQNINIDLG